MKYNIEESASFDVDAQKGFTPICPNELPVSGGDTITNELNAQAKYANIRVASKDAHCKEAVHTATQESPQFSPVGLPDVDIRWNSHCVMGTKGAELLDGLPHWKEYDFFVWKGIEPDTHPYGACYHDMDNKKTTGVIEFLKIRGIKNVILGGLALDFCLLTTALQLVDAGFNVVVNLSACKAIDVVDHTGENTLVRAMNKMAQANVHFVKNAKELDKWFFV